MVKETARTLLYVGIAVVSVGIAFATHYASLPKPLVEFEKVGTPFFSEDFDPNSAKSLQVTSFNEDSATISEFKVEFLNGKWIIPSHHNYPADAQDRLAKTAASVIGITRDALISRVAKDQERFQVLDPTNTDSTELKGRGSRITITREDGTVLTDLIIGNEIPDRKDHYYVRRPDEKETYISKVELDLSTKFSDWIEQDLLKINRSDLKDIVINKYSIDEVQGRIVDQEVNHLSKPESSNDWKLDDLKDENEEINTSNVSTLVGNLDELKIVGVRPKPQGLNPDLSLDPQIQQNPLLRQSFLSSLASAGFFLAKNQKGQPVMVSNEGELTAGTKEGAVYNIRFGQIFTGSTKEVETGLKKDSGKDKSDDKKEDSDNGEKEKEAKEKTSKEPEKSEEDSESKKNRYLFVSVSFDPKLLGPAPTKPKEPEKPAEVKKEETKKAESKEKEPKKEADKKTENKEKPVEKKEDDPQKKFEEAKKTYDLDLKKYEDDLKKHEEAIKAGKKKVDELNRRFADWYYVISAESFEELRLSRAELVKPKEKKPEGKPEDLLKSTDTPPNALTPPVKKQADIPPPSELEKKQDEKKPDKKETKATDKVKSETAKPDKSEVKTEDPPPKTEKEEPVKTKEKIPTP